MIFEQSLKAAPPTNVTKMNNTEITVRFEPEGLNPEWVASFLVDTHGELGVGVGRTAAKAVKDLTLSLGEKVLLGIYSSPEGFMMREEG